MMPNLKAVTHYVDLGCAIGAILDLDREYGAKDECTHETIQMCKRALDGLPVIEAEPVRHAKWFEMIESVEDGYTGEYYEEIYYNCMNCDYATTDKTPYCPNCGAKMDGE